MNVPSLTASERIENQLQQFRLDVFLPLLKPGVIVGIAFIVFRKRRLQAEANSEEEQRLASALQPCRPTSGSELWWS